MFRRLGNDTIYIQRATTNTDTVDNTQYYTFGDEIEVKYCSVQPFLPSDKLQYEVTAERDYARSTWRVYAPPTDDILALRPRDRVRFETRVYEVFGEVGAWRDRSGTRHHAQIILQTREG